MEIGPIPGIRAMDTVKAPGAGMRPPAIFEIDESAKPGDGERQRNGRKAAGAEEDDEDELMLEADDGRGSAELDKNVDYFA